MLKPPWKLLARHWWPVAGWLAIIRLESTDIASARNTLGLLDKACALLFGHLDPRLLIAINGVLRKGGHCIGYGILSVLVFLALKHTYRDCVKPGINRSPGAFWGDSWRLDWAFLAVLFVLVTASLDEIHQTFLRSRTGRWQDVAIDAGGALLMQLFLYATAALSRAAQRMSQRHNAAQETKPALIL